MKFGDVKLFSGWIKDDQEAFDILRDSAISFAKKLKATLESSDINTKGLKIHYHDLNSDFFNYDVRKWMVSIEESEVEGVTESMDELYETEVYCIIDIRAKKEVYCGSYHDCIEEIERMLSELDIQCESVATEIANNVTIEFKESYPHIVLR